MSRPRFFVGTLGLFLAASLSGCAPGPSQAESPRAGPAINQVLWIFIPAGEFDMGNAYDRGEMPPHRVLLSSFWIGRTEVTNAQYQKCVIAAACDRPARFGSYSRLEYFDNPDYDTYPVVYVNWNDAETFCRWAGGRLPTEAEWEHAARGPSARLYPWGTEAPGRPLGNFDFSVGDTSTVGAYPAGASSYGVLDMAGNVAEWVADWFENDYYSQSPISDPMGPVATGARVVRGGSWLDDANMVRADLRLGYPPDSAYMNMGFRCAQSTWALPGLPGSAGGTILR